MRKFALLVGVEEYRDKMISRLQFACADAAAVAERLRDRCGFEQVRVLADTSGDDEPLLVNIVTALRDTAAELRQDDLFLFFFAGHGVEKDGHGYLLARDSLQAFPEHGSLSLELLRKTFERLAAGKRIILLDACRNSPDAGRADAANCMGDAISRDIVAAARTSPTSGTTTALLSACQAGQRAYEWPAKGHGVFTQCLLEGLDGAAWKDETLDFKQLASFAAQRVREWIAGTPGLPVAQEAWYEEFGYPNSLVIGLRGERHRRPNRNEAVKTANTKASAHPRPTKKNDRAPNQTTPKGPHPMPANLDPRFTCAACGEASDATDGDLCTGCHKFIHRTCQKCSKVRKAWDWGQLGLNGLFGDRDQMSTYVCPVCGTEVRRERI